MTSPRPSPSQLGEGGQRTGEVKIMSMNSEKRKCQNCKQNFVIEPDDFGFYVITAKKTSSQCTVRIADLPFFALIAIETGRTAFNMVEIMIFQEHFSSNFLIYIKMFQFPA